MFRVFCGRAARAAALGVVASVLSYPGFAVAATINYGNSPVLPPGVAFQNISETAVTDAPPLYGAPSFFITGMSFAPTAAFSAEADNGAVDLTDGQLNFTIAASGAAGITGVGLGEGGLFSLTLVGTAATQAGAGASLKATITEINGAPVTPIVLTPASAMATYNLVANPGVDQPWSIALAVDVAAALAPGQRATRVDVVVDNALFAVSETETGASIAKNEFSIDIDTDVPEPATGALAAVGAAAAGAVARRRR